ncbi:Mycothiol acetyltransferase [bioreactor metagenome]|uniref:Mycothiol acetyltransferase n=1 Tax=bioreactor metagenome TaxID=1076179 RepID=A0A645A666_9ZZZZ|nr:GNAT family N-acetyltransferase [Christensenella sp.]
MQSIQVICQPELETIRQVRALETVCRAHDHREGSLSLNPSLNASPQMPCLITLREDDALVGAMTFFAPSPEEAEIVGLTHPDHRRAGIFRALASEAARQAAAFGIPSMLFICEPQSTSGVAAVAALGATPAHTEYSLCYQRDGGDRRLAIPQGLTLIRATEADLGAMSRISAESFAESAEQAYRFLLKAIASDHRTQYIARLNGEPVGIGCIGYEGGEATIYGLGVSPDQQGNGIGRGIISLMLEKLLASGIERILIEVDNTNANALHLYLSCGFMQESVFDYYRASVKSLLR